MYLFLQIGFKKSFGKLLNYKSKSKIIDITKPISHINTILIICQDYINIILKNIIVIPEKTEY
jgi:hypothetical protein